jgi:hypothetical protein
MGLARETVANAVHSVTPPRYSRTPAGSKLDPFMDWICERLCEDPTIQSQRLREMVSELGYAGGKTIFDEFVREVRPRYQVRRTFQRTIYRLTPVSRRPRPRGPGRCWEEQNRLAVSCLAVSPMSRRCW